uniref:Uncharacterized protein n=1 Tax=Kalanchoe fedtschenkoi TaxID=63787 RepID=A0A7N0VEV1_KALFE
MIFGFWNDFLFHSFFLIAFSLQLCFLSGFAFYSSTFVPDLDLDHRSRMEEARVESGLEERELSEELARIQETIAAPPMLKLARRATLAVDGEQESSWIQTELKRIDKREGRW